MHQHTRHSQHGSSCIDKLFVPFRMRFHVTAFEVIDENSLPNHDAVKAVFGTKAQDKWPRALAPPLVECSDVSPETKQRAMAHAIQQWEALSAQDGLDCL